MNYVNRQVNMGVEARDVTIMHIIPCVSSCETGIHLHICIPRVNLDAEHISTSAKTDVAVSEGEPYPRAQSMHGLYGI